MWMTTITASIRFSNVGDERLGVLKLALQRREQCVLGLDRECPGMRPALQADRVAGHSRFPGSSPAEASMGPLFGISSEPARWRFARHGGRTTGGNHHGR